MLEELVFPSEVHDFLFEGYWRLAELSSIPFLERHSFVSLQLVKDHLFPLLLRELSYLVLGGYLLEFVVLPKFVELLFDIGRRLAEQVAAEWFAILVVGSGR